MKFIVFSITCLITISVQFFHTGLYLGGIDDSIKLILINAQKYNNETSINGELLLKKMEEFYEHFFHFYEQVKGRKGGIEKAVDFFLNRKGPQFIHLTINDKFMKLKNKFHWNCTKLNTYIASKRKIEKLWRKFKKQVHYMKFEKLLRRMEETQANTPKSK